MTSLFMLVLCCLIPSTVAVTGYDIYLENIYSFNETVYNDPNSTNVLTDVHYLVNTAAMNGTDDITKSGMMVEALNASSAIAPLLVISMTIEPVSGSGVDSKFLITVEVDNPSVFPALDAEVDISLYQGLLLDETTLSGISLTDLTTITTRRNYIWNVGPLAAGETMSFTFEGKIDQDNLASNWNYYSCDLTYNETSSDYFGHLVAQVCVEKDVIEKQSVLYLHGFTALTFFMALILGILLVCLGFFIYYSIRRRKSVSPSKMNQERLIVESGKTIMLDEHEAVKRTGHTINVYSAIGEGDSIIGVLAMKDKMQMHREIDSLDIVNTVNVDTDLEKERNNTSMATTQLLLTGLNSNNDINKQTLDSTLGNLRSLRAHMDKQHDEDYKREMKKLYKKISAKNRSNMNTLMNRQKNEKKELVSNTQSLPAEEKTQLIKLMNEQHQSEQNAETYKLKLEQDEETEKLRKEFAIRSRMGLKEIQIQALNDVKDQGKLSDQQMKWLMAEHLKNQKKLEAMYDDEISRQRMVLEEKLAKRKALAQAAESQEEDNDELLNTVAGQQVIAVNKMKSARAISAADANVLIDQAKQDMIGVKNKMEADRARQEAELHKKLSSLKKKRLSDQAKEHEAELREFDRKCQEMQTDGPVDPNAYAEGRLKLLSQQRVEKATLDSEIDTQNLNELSELRKTIAIQTENDLREIGNSLKTTVSGDGNAQKQLERLMEEHRRETEMLRASQERDRQKQLHKLQDRLEENREQWNERKEAEKQEQEQLRDYEDNVVSKLVNSQVSMSEDERNRILKEHEKQMVKLENSLTLNKLRQKRMIEEKIAQRRAAQMDKLQMKQHSEKEAQHRKLENNAEDSDDEDVQREKARLMKEHVEQKMAVLQGRKMDWDTELESIRVEMLKERSLALKEQEEKLGALVAELQLSKAKELSKIEEQQRAIHNLKTNLIDDLNARGVLSDPETQAVIKRHQEEQEQLNQRLDEQRNKQEQMLREKLQLRLQHREKSMMSHQDEELKALVGTNKTAMKVKKMLLIHKHMVAMEKMRNQLEREISQTLEQVRYEYKICKRKAIQDQEMEFIAGLVRVGTIPKECLESVLTMLYPTKTDIELKEIMDKIFDPKLQAKQLPMDKQQASQLISRVRQTQDNPPPFLRRASQASLHSSISSRNSSMRRSSKKKKSGTLSVAREQQEYYDHDDYEDNSRFRPSSRQYEDSDYHPPSHRLEEPLRYSQEPSGYRQEPSGYRLSQHQTYNDTPHPLEEDYNSYSQKGSIRNGHPRSNRIMEEEDEDVVSATYMSPGQRLAPSKLPPLETTTVGKKKKKKKFLKKMAENSPRSYYDD